MGHPGFLNVSYRSIWAAREQFSAWIRYEDLVHRPGDTMAVVDRALGLDGEAVTTWTPADVPAAMIKHERHETLHLGQVTAERVGVWRSADRTYSDETHETARMVGYA